MLSQRGHAHLYGETCGDPAGRYPIATPEHRNLRRREWHSRRPEAGNAIVLSLIVLTALGTLALVTVVSVRGSLRTTANDNFHATAMYAAESGGAAAIEQLRGDMPAGTKWTSYVNPAGEPKAMTGLLGHAALPGATGNPFTASLGAWFEVEILNNRGDSGYVAGTDTDGRVIIRSTGHGPDDAIAIIEWEVTAEPGVAATPCRVYAQENQAEDNSGTNACIGVVDTSQTASFRP
jgi:Tfp pilus assembly protein PilX